MTVRPLACAVVLALLSVAAAPTAAQAPPQTLASLSDRDPLTGQAGVVATGLLLRQLDGEKRVLMIAAHPDDEDTALLAALARESGARVSYLSLTRGEGGQNVIGPELDEGLGIIRTGELLAARGLDDAGQYFTRAYDFGFSRSAEESFGHWPREELLDDVVRIVRTVRPQVVVSIFQGTPQDGHGHHQVAGIVAREAFHAAADPDRFAHHLAEGLDPWAPEKLYVSSRRRPDDATVRVETGRLDPLLGRSPFQIAMEGRSLHRSQEMGAPQHPGPRAAPLILVERRRGDPEDPVREEGIFAGIDTTLAAAVPDADPARLEAYRQAVHEAAAALDPRAPSAAAAPLSRAIAHLRAAASGGSGPGAGTGGSPTHRDAPAHHDASAHHDALAHRDALAQQALLAAAGVVIEARADRDRAVPGEAFQMELRVWNGGPFDLRHVEPGLDLPRGWTAEPLPPDVPATQEAGFFFGAVGGTLHADPADVAPGELARWRFRVTVSPDAEPTREYHLWEPRDEALYRWPDDPALKGLPGTPPAVTPRVTLQVSPPGGETVALGARVPLRHVAVDRVDGEFRERFLVVPRLSVALERQWMVWPRDQAEPRTLTVRVRSEALDETAGEARLEAPSGWLVEPAVQPFTLQGRGREAELAFALQPALGPDGERTSLPEPGRFRIQAVVTAGDGQAYREGFQVIDHPHIDRVPLYRPAAVDVTVVPVQVAQGLRVGYVMGSGDDGAEALRQMGAQVELLGPETLRSGDLDRFHTLVLGVRAYEVRPELSAVNARILEFARRGGTVLVQYHKYEYPDGEFAPFPVAMARPHDRVTDPDAPVRPLDPSSPLLTGPNAISAEDFGGWVQERGLYFLNRWDSRYTPLLEMADPGLEPVQGALVAASLGEGLYIYTGLAFFRQIPAGVPGAFRLLANLASATGEAWRAHHVVEHLEGVPEGSGSRKP